MNTKLESFARTTLLEGLSRLPEGHQSLFKRMYSGARTTEEAVAIPIERVVAGMPDDKLDWAMTQVQNSLKKLEAKTA